MKHIAYSLLLVLLTAGVSLPSAPTGVPQPYDTVTLKDGRVIKGQVVDEESSSIVMMVRGSKRSFGRNFVAKIAYGEDNAALPSGAYPGAVGPGGYSSSYGPGERQGPPYGTAQPPDSAMAPRGNLVRDLATRYQVSVGDVLWVRAQGVSDIDLPLVFLVAATAGVTPRQVVKLYRQGMSWPDIENYFQMQPQDVTYPSGADASDPVYDPVYVDPNAYVDPNVYVGLGWGAYGYDGPWGGYGWGGYGWGGDGDGDAGWGGGYGWGGDGDGDAGWGGGYGDRGWGGNGYGGWGADGARGWGGRGAVGRAGQGWGGRGAVGRAGQGWGGRGFGGRTGGWSGGGRGFAGRAGGFAGRAGGFGGGGRGATGGGHFGGGGGSRGGGGGSRGGGGGGRGGGGGGHR